MNGGYNTNLLPRLLRWAWPLLLAGYFGCDRPKQAAPLPPAVPGPAGEVIVAAGESFTICSPVVLWDAPNGYNGYLERCFFTPDQVMPTSAADRTSTKRYSTRRARTTALAQRVREEGWTLRNLRDQVDQFIIHFDAVGTSRGCFRVLHDVRGLSSHFLLDLDGTIYQTMDLKERAWHAAETNDRSIGVEIANIGSHGSMAPLEKWYVLDEAGLPYVVFPSTVTESGLRIPNYIARPARPELFTGKINGRTVMQYDFTPEQYEALARLTAGLTQIFPKIKLRVPRDASRNVRPDVVPAKELRMFQGLVAHWHLTKGKVDPGPAFDWDRVLSGAKGVLESSARTAP